MRVLFYKDNIITEVVSVRSLNDLTEEDKKQEFLFFENSNTVEGMDIRAINKNGSIKPISEQIDLGIIKLADDEVLEGDTIRKLTEEELKEKYPDRYPNKVPQEESTEKTVQQAIQEKENEVKELKEQYIDADLDDNDKLRLELKQQIQELRQEIAILRENLNEDNI